MQLQSVHIREVAYIDGGLHTTGVLLYLCLLWLCALNPEVSKNMVCRSLKTGNFGANCIFILFMWISATWRKQDQTYFMTNVMVLCSLLTKSIKMATELLRVSYWNAVKYQYVMSVLQFIAAIMRPVYVNERQNFVTIM